MFATEWLDEKHRADKLHSQHHHALLTLAAIVATARNEPDTPLRAYILSLTEDLDLPSRFPDENR